MQQVVNGLFLGSIYALFALGYTLVFGVLDILNLAHAAVFTVCAFLALALVGTLHLLTLLLRRTRLGRQIRAVAESPLAARILGVDVDRVIAASFFISSALGGAAGVLFGLAFNDVSADMGRSVELKGLAVIILGGMGSMPGAVLAGYGLGLIEVFTVAQVGSSWRDGVSFAVLFLVLLLRPRGLLGQAATRLA